MDLIAPPIDDYLTGSYVYIPGTAFLPRAVKTLYAAEPPQSFFSSFLSGAQPLPNGNTLICAGAQGRFLEVTSAGAMVWEYVNPVTDQGPIDFDAEIPIFAGRNANIVFRATHYGTDYPGLAGRNLSPGDPIETNFPGPYDCALITDVDPLATSSVEVYPNPAGEVLRVSMAGASNLQVRLFDAFGRLWNTGILDGGLLEWEIRDWPAGIYWLAIEGAPAVPVMVAH